MNYTKKDICVDVWNRRPEKPLNVEKVILTIADVSLDYEEDNRATREKNIKIAQAICDADKQGKLR